MLRGAALAVLALALAGCGGSAKKACPQLTKLDREVAAMRATSSPAVASRLTDEFLHDVAVAPIDNLTRNRMIDHAAAAVSGTCPQCFQALESERPIISIRWRPGGSKRYGSCSST